MLPDYNIQAIEGFTSSSLMSGQRSDKKEGARNEEEQHADKGATTVVQTVERNMEGKHIQIYNIHVA